MSLFDPLYQIETTAPPTLEEINKVFADFDGSGSGLMSVRQMVAACEAIPNLGFTKEEIQNYVKEGQDVAGDENGRIKMTEFASYLAFEAKKKYKKNGGNKKDTPKSGGNGGNGQKGDDYVNPFLNFLSDGNNQQQQQQQQHPNPNVGGMKITLTPDPKQSPEDANADKVDMTSSYSPTESDPTDLPNWFGHSINTITTHPNQPTNDDPFGFPFFDDDAKTKPKPSHTSVPTQDLIFADDDATSPNGSGSSNNGVSKSPNLSPRKARNLNKSGKNHNISKSTNTGLIPKPRSKGDKPKEPKKKKRSSVKHGNAMSASFTNVFGDISTDHLNFDMDEEDDKPSKKKKKKMNERLKLTKAHSEMVPDTTKLKSRDNDKNTSKDDTASQTVKKKKRPKIDAIVEMKRGAAMLKYGRRGFPHFRRFQISHDLTKLLWYSRKKSLNETHVSIKEMKDILDGQQTEVFKQCTQKTLEKASFSIIYGSKLKSLDVVAKSAEEAQLWIKGLKGLIKANQQGKLHKVVQILVDVDFKDISKTKYRQCTDDERRKYEVQHKNRPELVHTITTTLQQSRKIFQSLVKISSMNNVQNSNEYENIQTLTSEIEERLEEIEYGLHNKTADLTDLKRDVWVLKVDVTVLEEKVKVLSKIKTAIPI